MDRRLDVGAALSNSFDLFARGWRYAVMVMLVVGAVSGAIAVALVPRAFSNPFDLLGADTLAGMFLTTLVSFLGTAVVLAYGRRLQSAADPGSVDSQRTLDDVTANLGPLLALLAIVTLGLLVGFALLIIPGLILGVAWSLAMPAVMFERASPTDALGRSWELVRPSFAPMLGLIVVLVLIAAVAGGILGAIVDGLVPGRDASYWASTAVSQVPYALVAFGTWSAWMQLTPADTDSGEDQFPSSDDTPGDL